MAVTGIPLTILTAIIPSLMLAIGFTEDVHMISEYHHRLEHGDDKLTALRTMLGESAMPILVTTATTVLGFGSLITTDITMLIQFGYASAMALTANYVVTMLLLPPMLRWWAVPRRLRRVALADESPHGGIPRLMQRLGGFNLRWRVPILVAWGVLTLGSLAGWLPLRGNTHLISFFPEPSDQVAQYLLMLEGRELEKFVDFKAAAANIVVRHHLTGSGDLSALLRDIERHVARDFPPTVIVRATGEEVLFNNASDYMAINELTSFSSTFVIIGAIHALLFIP